MWRGHDFQGQRSTCRDAQLVIVNEHFNGALWICIAYVQTEKEFSLQHSAVVNHAYNTLQKPLARGLYMLRLSEENLEHEMHIAISEFLDEILEVNEAILDADSPDTVAVIGAENQSKIDDLVRRISYAFRQNDHAAAKELLLRLKYYSNIADKIKDVLQKYVGWCVCRM